MNAMLNTALAMAAVAISAQAVAGPTFYEREDFQGRSFTAEQQVRNFERIGFNDRASSVVVTGGRGERWEVCEDARFSGRCVVLRPGRYPSLAAMGLNDRVSSVRAVSRNTQVDNSRYAPDPNRAAAQVVFYEREGFQGRSFTAAQEVRNFERIGFNDRASSAVVTGDRWEVCEDNRFGGRCAVLRPGRYPSLAAMGLNDRVSSVREVSSNTQIDNHRYAPPAAAAYDNRRRHDERLYQANVTSVHAVAGTPGQRCWVEQEQVPEQSSINVPGAIIGAAIGGVIGIRSVVGVVTISPRSGAPL